MTAIVSALAPSAALRLLAEGTTVLAWLTFGWAAMLAPWTTHALAAPALLAGAAWLIHAAAREREARTFTAACARLRQRQLKATLDTAHGSRPLHAMCSALEAEALAPQALAAAWGGLLAAARLPVIGVAMLRLGAPLQAACTLLALLLACAWIPAHARRQLRFGASQLAQTQVLAQHLEAHGTRQVQQPPAQWHREEDTALARLLEDSARLDASTLRGLAWLPHGYLLVGFAGLGPALADPVALSGADAAVCGLVLLAAVALGSMAGGIVQGMPAWAAWRVALRPFRVAGSDGPPPLDVAAGAGDAALVVVRGLRLQPAAGPMLLDAGQVDIRRGERWLLSGPAGSGKSSLAAVLAGLQSPAAGIVLVGGLDRQAMGDDAWRRTVALAPAPEANHLLAATLATNLLLGRPLPHGPQDHEDAWRLCLELGLGPLVQRMPEGLHQRVGEAGWRLSQGEAARVFVARALLQRAQLVILDQGFAALDPHSLALCVQCARRHAPTLIVISPT